MNFFRISAIFVFTTLFCQAQKSPTHWLTRASNNSPGPFKQLAPMSLNYSMTLNNRLNAGKMEVSIIKPDSGVYFTKITGGSTGLARALINYDFIAEGQTDTVSLKPLSFHLVDEFKGKKTTFSTLFQPFQMVNKMVVEDLKTGIKTPRYNEVKLHKDAGMSLISSALYLRSQVLDKGQEISLITSSFGNPYLIDFKVLGRDKRSVNGKDFKAIKIAVFINEINTTTMAIKPYSNIEKATVWISDDKFRVPIEFSGDIFIGSINVRLTDRMWSTNELAGK